MTILETINNIEDLKRLNIKQLPQLAQEIRDFLIKIIPHTGGHLASNLGVVELTIALLYVYDVPADRIIWDVGHQSYVYKILTGRRDMFDSIRREGGISGFPNIRESKYDCFGTGHSSTSISAMTGIARARDLKKETYNVVSVIGDGSLGGGMALEALNDLGASKTKALVVLNDNEMSISKNVGGISNHLNRIRVNRGYTGFKLGVSRFLKAIPLVGKHLNSFFQGIKNSLKLPLIKGKIFEQMGLVYVGPVNGHNIKQLVSLFKRCQNYCDNKPLFVHVVTKKGKGMPQAENNPVDFHGIAPSDSVAVLSNSATVGSTLCELAKTDNRVVAITAAMKEGTGLIEFAKNYPERFFDVGIAEQHAVTMGAGLAINGFKPYVCIYSTFLQRAYDQILHDVGLQNLPVTFCIDRAGAIGSDGATHQGLYDFSYLRAVPNMTIAVPKDNNELVQILNWSLSFNRPLAIRYPKDSVFTVNISQTKIEYGKWQPLQVYGQSNIWLFAAGERMLELAYGTSKELLKENIQINIINCCFIKPIDTELLDKIKNGLIICLEDHCKIGGLFSAVSEHFASLPDVKVSGFGLSDDIIDNRTVKSAFEASGINVGNVLKSIKNYLDI